MTSIDLLGNWEKVQCAKFIMYLIELTHPKILQYDL
jgi:hypothetical protein